MVVTTRGGTRRLTPKEVDSSSDDESIAARTPPVRREPASSRTPATLRPSREPTTKHSGLPKRKQSLGATSNVPPHKRQRRASEAADTIEAQGEDDNVDAAINATSVRPATRIEVRLPSSRAYRNGDSNNDSATEVLPETSITGATAAPSRRLRARHLNRNFNSVELFGPIEALRPRTRKHGVPDSRTAREAEEVSDSAESPAPAGSPELQSPARKPQRETKAPADMYEFPDPDAEPEAPNPPNARGGRTANILGVISRRQSNRRPERQPQSPQRDRLSLIREEQSRSATPHHEPRQAAIPNARPSGPSLKLVNEDDDELMVIGNGRAIENENEQQYDSEETDETSVSKLDEEAEQPKMNDIQVRPYANGERTMSVSSGHLKNISEIMGRSGWTGAGRRWMAELDANMFELEDNLSTRLGRLIFQSLGRLKDKLDDVPNALDLAGQSRFLVEHQRALNELISNVDRAVGKAEGATLRNRLVNDLSTYAIPMLVLVMRTTFAIGVQEPDAMVNDSPAGEGVFTWTTIQYLLATLGWLSRLQKRLSEDLSSGPGNKPEARDRQPYDPEDRTQNREKMGVMVKKFIQQIRHEVDSFNKQADVNRERYEKDQRMKQINERDRQIKEQREKEEMEELALVRRREEAFMLSINQLRNQPRPLAQRFQRAIAHWSPSPSSSNQAQSRSPSVRSSFPPLPQRARPALPPPSASSSSTPELDYPPWPRDDTEWLLSELTRPDRVENYLEVCVETLDRPMQEIMAEMRRLERRGLLSIP